MAAGTTITGEDGIIKIGATNEIPCLTAWSFDASAELQNISTRCMKSNADGGSAAAGGFSKKVLGDKSASLTATFDYQEDDAAGAAGDLRTDNVGDLVDFELYPRLSTAGKRIISGSGYITAVGVPSQVDGKITQTITIEVDGAWTDTTV